MLQSDKENALDGNETLWMREEGLQYNCWRQISPQA